MLEWMLRSEEFLISTPERDGVGLAGIHSAGKETQLQERVRFLQERVELIGAISDAVGDHVQLLGWRRQTLRRRDNLDPALRHPLDVL